MAMFPVRPLAVVASLLLCWPAAHAADGAGSREEPGTFRIGLVAEPGSGKAVDGLPALRQAYELALGMPVDFLVADSYATLIEAQQERRVDYGVYSATAYALAARACGCLSPVVAPTDANGALGIRSVLIVKTGLASGKDDLPKLRVAIGPPDDVAGHMLPLAELRRQGMAVTGEEAFFLHAASMEAAQKMFLDGEANALFGWIETGRSPAPLPDAGTPAALRSAGAADGAFAIVWTSDLLRFGPHAVRSDLDPEIRRRLVPFLVGLRDVDAALFEALEKRHSGGFVPVDDADYATARDMVETAAPAARR